jgi:hypothetical protein
LDSHAAHVQKVASFAAKRVCADLECSTVLSIYNGSDFCFAHEPRFRQGKNNILR